VTSWWWTDRIPYGAHSIARFDRAATYSTIVNAVYQVSDCKCTWDFN